ncbi:MAG TPA: RecX family transcriptional regulator [Bacteroidota bacterium]|nr:RecX family transcriptional regulator [Bacteroidota bacterium]
MRITRIEPQQHDPTRRNIYIDGEYALGVSAETLLRFGLRTGDELTSERLQALQAAENAAAAKRHALRLLSRRPRSEKEIRDALRTQEFSQNEIETALRDLRSAGLLDDERFARSYIRDHVRLRPKGPVAVRQKLLLLGISKDIIDRSLEEEFPHAVQEQVAYDLAVAFVDKSSRARTTPQVLRQKLAAILSRRGFTWDVISTVVNKVLRNSDTGDIE